MPERLEPAYAVRVSTDVLHALEWDGIHTKCGLVVEQDVPWARRRWRTYFGRPHGEQLKPCQVCMKGQTR